MFADLFSPDKAYGSRISFALNYGQPSNSVIEHGGGSHESGVFERYVD
jgi:hypothetical protein